ncbi:MAG: class I SAM-dependent methyltransferase [Acidobacteriota bacterium]
MLLPREALRGLYSLSPAHVLAARKLPARGRILDAGCGFGPVSILNPRASSAIVGIDSSRELIRIAARLSPESMFQVGSICSLPYPSTSFDMYMGISSLELVQEGLGPPLDEAFRVLKKGGRLMIVCPRLQPDWVSHGFRWTDSTVGRLMLYRVSGARSPLPADGYGYYYSLRELCDATRAVGFAEVRGSRADMLGGLCYGRMLGRRLRRVLFPSTLAVKARETERLDGLLRKLGRGMFDYEVGHLEGDPLTWLGRLMWSFWNVVWATRP